MDLTREDARQLLEQLATALRDSGAKGFAAKLAALAKDPRVRELSRRRPGIKATEGSVRELVAVLKARGPNGRKQKSMAAAVMDIADAFPDADAGELAKKASWIDAPGKTPGTRKERSYRRQAIEAAAMILDAQLQSAAEHSRMSNRGAQLERLKVPLPQPASRKPIAPRKHVARIGSVKKAG
jgi:hypothetical protein